MEFVLTSSTLLCGYRSILNTDNGVTDSTIFNTTKVKVHITFKHSQSVNNVTILNHEILVFPFHFILSLFT